MSDALEAGFTDRPAYGLARRKELRQALELVSIPDSCCHEFGCPDKETWLHLPDLISRLDSLIEELKPSIVISHTYEGGHPDHDSASFVVAVAQRKYDFRAMEFPLYRSDSSGQMVTGSFIDNAGTVRGERLELSDSERRLKADMLACFVTQANVLSWFDIGVEWLRPTPVYDFSRPPHPEPLLYERWGWGISGSAWRKKAAEAARL